MHKKTVAALGARIDRVRARAKRDGIPAVEIGRRAIAGLLAGKTIRSGMIVQKEIRADAYAIIERLASDAGMSPDAFMAAAGGYTLVSIPTKTANRFREIEVAADLECGAVLASLVEYGEGWWEASCDLDGHITEGFDLADAATVRKNLKNLQAKWKREDAGQHPAPDRERLTFDVCRGTALALRKLATAREATVASVGGAALTNEANKAMLGASDYRKIGKAVGRAQKAERAEAEFDDSDIKLPPSLIKKATKLAKGRGMTLSEFFNYLVFRKFKDFRKGTAKRKGGARS